ncbi:MAG: ubiquinone-binding protein [Betaproteobacteria bacterium RIFCSPLOWO2_12_FULL_63_13]|nr:MAG: ubiquinone-binding protein [Betaproteobacteria bacterium RIFCSPLOWO2_02_FULL_63_19]OGA49410.1 MAG: ubiquinone-binding protein [Betaproteobacteria bacterium RIFCSPLOWO2_12_FULL_63_13]
MITISRSSLVGYSAEKMYALVEDIESYPKFLPWCSGAEISVREGTRTVATMHVNFHGIRESFTTENANVPSRMIAMELLSGPFRHLRGHWQFTPLSGEGCKIEFRLEYEISNRLLAKLIGPVFQHIGNSFVDAFIRRAERIYARR